MRQLGKRAFRSYWDCFSHLWEVIWRVLCKCDQEKNRVDVSFHLTFFSQFYIITFFLIVSFLSITFTLSLCCHNVDKLLSLPTSSSLSTSLPLHLSLPFHLTCPHFPISHNTSLPPYKSLPLSLSFSKSGDTSQTTN